MTLNGQSSYYDILDIPPDASPQEVREAYLRAKLAYHKDSVALYTLVGTAEREEMLGKIEEAYDTLSNADRRKAYDRSHGLLDIDEDIQSQTRVPFNKKIISIDRVPPMDSSANAEHMLVAPSTDFTGDQKPASAGMADLFGASEPEATASEPAEMTPAQAPPPSPAPEPAGEPAQETPRALEVAPQAAPPPVQPPRRTQKGSESALNQEIAQEVEWRGGFLRKIRETRRISIEEMSSITKVTKNYILAIEEENFSKLPAAVFLRGFVTQIAKVLKLPYDQVTPAYMARYFQSRPDKTAQ